MNKESGAPHAGALSFLSIAALILLAGILAATFFPGHDVVVISVDDRIIATIPLAQDEELVYCYTHSVERSEVREYFRIVKGGLVLTRTAMKSFGAGLPSEQGNGFDFQDGWYVLELWRPVTNLVFRVSPFLEQKLMTEKVLVDLSGLETGLRVELRLTRRPAIWLHIKEVVS
jgi:hypothetical protein